MGDMMGQFQEFGLGQQARIQADYTGKRKNVAPTGAATIPGGELLGHSPHPVGHAARGNAAKRGPGRSKPGDIDKLKTAGQ
jgi:hypothetical protein